MTSFHLLHSHHAGPAEVSYSFAGWRTDITGNVSLWAALLLDRVEHEWVERDGRLVAVFHCRCARCEPRESATVSRLQRAWMAGLALLFLAAASSAIANQVLR